MGTTVWWVLEYSASLTTPSCIGVTDASSGRSLSFETKMREIEFTFRYEFDAKVVGTLAGPVFDRIATFVDAFVAPADRTVDPCPVAFDGGAAPLTSGGSSG